MTKNPREPKAVKKLMADAYNRLPPVPPIPRPPTHVIPAESLWDRFRRRKKSS